MKEELGMYWPVDWGYYWYQLPVETQALMVEVFGEVANDAKSVEELRIWLLKNKQTNRWESTKATAEAVYALLFNGQLAENTKPVQGSGWGKTMKPSKYEAGTGYFKENWAGQVKKSSWSGDQGRKTQIPTSCGARPTGSILKTSTKSRISKKRR
jgi:hypothetical protein